MTASTGRPGIPTCWTVSTLPGSLTMQMWAIIHVSILVWQLTHVGAVREHTYFLRHMYRFNWTLAFNFLRDIYAGSCENLMLKCPSSAGNCPKPLKNRDVVTLRSWQVKDDEYIIINFSVKHPVSNLQQTNLLHICFQGRNRITWVCYAFKLSLSWMVMVLISWDFHTEIPRSR